MGIYHRIREKLAIWDSNSKFKICIFSWKFWISRMKSWSNTLRWNFVDLKVVGRLTSVQLFIETFHRNVGDRFCVQPGPQDTKHDASWLLRSIIKIVDLQVHCWIWEGGMIKKEVVDGFSPQITRFLSSMAQKTNRCPTLVWDSNLWDRRMMLQSIIQRWFSDVEVRFYRWYLSGKRFFDRIIFIPSRDKNFQKSNFEK